jgi:transcriptional coactivator HFI1/ADA1
MNPADLTINTSPTVANRPAPLSISAPLKNGRIPVPRVDLETTYTQLKAALGDQWADYKAAISHFAVGMLACDS